MRYNKLKELAERIGFNFTRFELFDQALTHKSYTKETTELNHVEHNERLEFLGDAVLNLIVSEMLMKLCPNATEGSLSRMRAALVNKNVLTEHAAKLGLGDILQLGKGEESSGGRTKVSLLANAFEAVLGAAFFDGGLGNAQIFIHQTLEKQILQMKNSVPDLDPKSLLQERMQAKGKPSPKYIVAEISGPPHAQMFTVKAVKGKKEIGRGIGHSKKAAEQAAAQDVLDRNEIKEL